jgi:hypothetical protein
VGGRSRGRFATPADFRLHDIVDCTHMFTYAAEVRDLSIVQGPVSVAPCQNPEATIRRCGAHLLPARRCRARAAWAAWTWRASSAPWTCHLCVPRSQEAHTPQALSLMPTRATQVASSAPWTCHLCVPRSQEAHTPQALSLMPTIIGNTFAASLRTDICPQRKEARPRLTL